MNWVKEGLFLGAIAYVYQEITNQKILDNNNLKYATIGGVLGLVLGPKIEDYINKEESLTPEMRKKILGAGVGAIGGYALGDKIADQTKKTFAPLEKRVEYQDR